MKPQRIKYLAIPVVILGLIVTQACGSSQSSGGSLTSGSGSSGGGVTITNEVSVPADMEVGDIIMTQFSSSLPTEFDFDGADSGSQYYLAIASLDSGYGSHSIRIDTSVSALASENFADAVYSEGEDDWEGWTANDAFSQRLHDVGLAMAVDPEVEIATPSSSEVGFKASMGIKSLSVDDTESLRVLNSLSSMSNYATITARVKCVTDNIILYLDTEVESTNPDDLEESDIDMLCENFDEQVELERSWFGDESDVNGDNKVAALLTPQVNRLGAMGGGIITGFFLASDLYTRTSSNSVSNEREIVYALVPDSRGDYGTVIPKSFAIANLLTAVLPHEFQHVISYNQHVFQGEGTPEENWLNEGLSHLTEDLVGYGQENYSRVGVYFSNTPYYQVAGYGSPGLGERGAAYLFMRFLYEQHPDPAAFLRALYTSNTNGVANIEAAYDGTSSSFDQFGEFLMRYVVAVMATDQGLTQDERYVFQPRTYNYDTQRYQGICLDCVTDDGRGTVLTGPSMKTYSGSDYFSVYSSAVKFYAVTSVPDSISFSGVSSGTYGAVLLRKR